VACEEPVALVAVTAEAAALAIAIVPLFLERCFSFLANALNTVLPASGGTQRIYDGEKDQRIYD
jgi:hypothetical protein